MKSISKQILNTLVKYLTCLNYQKCAKPKKRLRIICKNSCQYNFYIISAFNKKKKHAYPCKAGFVQSLFALAPDLYFLI